MSDPAADITSFEAMRHAMVQSQLRTNAVNDPRVVTAMATVAREKFVPEDVRRLAYRDTAVAIGNGRHLNVPIATGKLLTEAYLLPADKVLLIGAAGGYTAAVLARLVASVVAVESDHDLAAHAKRCAGRIWPTSRWSKGRWKRAMPRARRTTCWWSMAASSNCPRRWSARLRRAAGSSPGSSSAACARLATGRAVKGGFGLRAFADIDCVALPGFAAPRGFAF